MRRSSSPMFSTHILVLAGVLAAIAQFAQAGKVSIPIVLEEQLGHQWASQIMHKTVDVPEQGQLYAGKCALFASGKEVPMQLDNIQCFSDGSIKQADVWFRTDMPANGKRALELRSVRRPKAVKTDVYVETRNDFIEIGNRITAIRAPIAGKNTSSGPIMGIKLANGKWTGRSAFSAQEELDFPQTPGLIQDLPNEPAGRLQGCTTEVLANGPIFYRYRINYRFADDGTYGITFTVRSEDPVIYVDEIYERAGALTIDLDGYRPKRAWYKSNRMHKGKAIELAYEGARQFAIHLGWDGYFTDVAPAYIFTGADEKQCLALVSTDADWLPFPYNQALHLWTKPEGLTIEASLQNGHRHWGIFVGLEDQFEDPVNEFYPWWWQNLCINMDKVLNWQLVWPGMDELEFPHTFFSREDLPGIREQLQNNPVVRKFMTHPRYKNPKKFTDAATVLFYSGDKAMYALLKNPKLRYIDGLSDMLLEKTGFYGDHNANNMQITDELLKRYIGIELLLGSDQITPAEKKKLLIQLAFLQYVTNDSSYKPLIYPFAPVSPDPYPGYVCGTPNQKICYLTGRGLVAAMLKNHPEFENWTDRVMDDFDHIVADSVAESGAHLESPFYSSRDTMRFGPFWTAMKRAGVIGGSPKALKWEKKLKRCYQYMSHMLTIPDPRLQGRRAYHPIGRSSPGILDPTIMISGMPFGEGDETFIRQQRWCWEAQGRPSPDVMGNTGGRDMSLTILAFLPVANAKPSDESPLRSIRYQGMGLIGRSQVGTDYESNILFRQDPFCWNLYEANNGAVYLWGKGAPLSIRFGGYWNHNPSLMSIPFGNRLIFDKGRGAEWTDGIGTMTDYCLMNGLADYGVSVSRNKDWQREVLFVKDMNREDPIFLLVRDDTSRKGSASAVHWWVMSKDVQPGGYESVGVIPPKGFKDEDWIKKLGKNWKDAPKLEGQTHRFPTHFNVDLDMFIASPANPKIVTDAVGFKPRQPYCVNRKMCEYQQLIRIEQGEGKHYLTLLSPSEKDEKARSYRTIADGYGVVADTGNQQNRLFLAPKKVSYQDDMVKFDGKAGFARAGAGDMIRLMVIDGTIESQGFKLSSTAGKAGLFFDGKQIRIYGAAQSQLEFMLPERAKNIAVKMIHCE